MTTEEVIHKVSTVMKNHGVQRSVKIVMRDGSIIYGVPHGLEPGTDEVTSIRVLEAANDQSRLIPADQIAEIGEAPSE